MDDLQEKVMQGLECCKSRSTCNDKCPYYHIMEDPNFGMDDCTSQLAADALSLLKAQEPRVMTLEEACNADCVWYDQINMGVRPAKVNRVPHKIGVYRIMRFGDIDTYDHANEYGEYWRCWTSRPTDEQREATPWPSIS